MKKLLLFLFCLSAFSSSAQLSINWVNHFCCFDSIAPHSFSVPIGKHFDGDTLIFAYWQDSTYRVRKISMSSGNDYQYNELQLVNVPFHFTDVNYYNGDFFKLLDRYWFIGNGTNHPVANNYNLVAGNLDISEYLMTVNEFSLSKIGRAIYSEADSTYMYCTMRDTNIEVHWSYIKAPLLAPDHNSILFNVPNAVKLFDDIYQSGNRFYVANSRSIDGSFGTCLQVNAFDTILSSTQSQTYFQTAGKDHKILQLGDSLICAFTDSANFDVSFIKIAMLPLNCDSFPIHSTVTDIYGIRNFNLSPDSQFFYVRTANTFSKFDRSLNLIFSRPIPNSTSDASNKSAILFDDDSNPVMAYSIINNQVSNTDLLILRLSKSDGSTLDSLHYNDPRNTADHLLDMYHDPNGNLELVYSSDLDTMFFLAEETQISVMQVGAPTLGIHTINSKDVSLSVYPNPVMNSIHVSISEKVYRYQIINNLGQVVLQGSASPQNEILVSSLHSGIYFLKVMTEDGVEEKRFVKL